MADHANTMSPNLPPLSQERLKQLISYDPNTGEFKRLVSLKPWREKADGIGSMHKTGYLVVSVDGLKYKAHRLAWFYMTGEWPVHFIDHIDRNRLNNSFVNLRLASNKANCQNRSAVTGKFVGTAFNKATRKWTAQIRSDGKNYHLGYFKCETAAHIAYRKAKRIHHQLTS